MTQHILFNAAGLKLAIEANLVAAVHENLHVQSVAGTCHWFLGLAVANGKLLPVTDVGAFAGRQCCKGHTLELAESMNVTGLRIDTVKGMSTSNIAILEKQRQYNNAFANRILLTGEVLFHDGETHHVLNMAAIVESPAFVNIRELQH